MWNSTFTQFFILSNIFQDAERHSNHWVRIVKRVAGCFCFTAYHSLCVSRDHLSASPSLLDWKLDAK